MKHDTSDTIAIYYDDVFSGFAMYEINEDFAIIARFERNRETTPRRHKVYWTAAGEPFLRYQGRRLKLDDFRTTY